MAFFDDMTAALAAYPEDNVTIEIVDVAIPGEVLNINEIGTFWVVITNHGPLNMTGVTLRIEGLNGTKVAATQVGLVFVDEIVTSEIPVIKGQGGSEKLDFFRFKAPASSSQGVAQNLLKASLKTWDANLDRILIGNSQPMGNVKAVYPAEVVES